MKSWTEGITVKAPASTVYEYVSDFSRHGEWAGHGLQVTKDTDGPEAVGTTFSTTAKQFGTQREHSTITDMSPGKAFAWDSKGALGTVHHSFTLSDDAGSTGLTKTAEFTQPSFLAKLTGWKLSKDVPAGLRSDLQNIKTHLEAAGS
jgi:uncharacterized membrane protein